MIKENNYFKECNPNWCDENFNFNKRVDPDFDSELLITDLSDVFLKKSMLPCGYFVKTVEIKRTRDKNKRYYAEVQIFNEDKWYSTFGVTSDYIGASVYWALKANVDNKIILEHLEVSRTLMGHVLFPTWFIIINSRPSWLIYPNDNISINMARGGEKTYYDRFDYTLFAIKEFFNNQGRKTKLTEVLEMNKSWLALFESFEKYVEFFKLNGLINDDHDVYDLTSFDGDKFTDIIESDDNVSIPTDEKSYLTYMDGVEHFIYSRKIKYNMK